MFEWFNPLIAWWTKDAANQPSAFATKMAAWSAVIAASSFGLGAVAQQRLQTAEADAQQLATAGDTQGAIDTLADASHTSRGTLRAQVRAGAQQANQLTDEHLAQLNADIEANRLDGATIDARMDAIMRRSAEHRDKVATAYVRTYVRERLQLMALRKTLDPAGQALVDARLEELEAKTSAVEDYLYRGKLDEEAVEAALAVDGRPPAEERPIEQREGFVKGLQALATNPDTVAVQPDTVATAPALAVAEEPGELTADAGAEAEQRPLELNMTLGEE